MIPSRRNNFWMRGQIDKPVDLPFVFRRLPGSGLACLCLVLCLWSTAVSETGRPNDEFRGLWVVRHWLKDREQVMHAVRTAVEARMNALLVQVRGRGDAFYASRLVPRAESLSEPDFDPLALLVEEGRRAGLEVHAWVNVYLTWHPTERRPGSAKHVFLQHPEWFMHSADGIDLGRVALNGIDLVKRSVEGRYLSPGNAEVRTHLLGVIEEIVTEYDVDGIHMDYVRYPNIHYDYNPAVTAEFTRRFGFDPAQWKEYRGKPGRDESEASETRMAWEKWRSGQISVLVRQVHELLSRLRPGARLSAAVKPDIELAYTQYGQDWTGWINGGLVDFVVPMFYEGSTAEIGRQMAEARKRVKRGRLYAGIGIWNQGADDTVAQIDVARRAGMQGVVLFSADGFVRQKSLAGRLLEGPFREPAPIAKEEGTCAETQARRPDRD